MADDDDQKAHDAAMAEVVRLHPERDLTDEDALVASAPREPGGCGYHRQFVLDRKLHRITCKQCEQEIDPFEVVARYVSDWERYATFRKEAKRRADEAHERLKELLRLEANARSRLKRIDPEAAEKAPQRPWGHGSTDF